MMDTQNLGFARVGFKFGQSHIGQRCLVMFLFHRSISHCLHGHLFCLGWYEWCCRFPCCLFHHNCPWYLSWQSTRYDAALRAGRQVHYCHLHYPYFGYDCRQRLLHRYICNKALHCTCNSVPVPTPKSTATCTTIIFDLSFSQWLLLKITFRSLMFSILISLMYRFKPAFKKNN